jgi:hypothetical protein
MTAQVPTLEQKLVAEGFLVGHIDASLPSLLCLQNHLPLQEECKLCKEVVLELELGPHLEL